jgi:uncharacterized membrane protein
VSIVTVGLTAVVGLIIAYVKRPELASTPFGSHMTYAIRTFWVSLLGWILGGILTVVLIGYPLLLVVALWFVFRCVRGLLKALDHRAIDDPTGRL